MGFNLTTNNTPSSLSVSVNDTTVTTRVTDTIFSVSDPVDEFLSTFHNIEASLELIKLVPPWPEIQVQISKNYEPYQ